MKTVRAAVILASIAIVAGSLLAARPQSDPSWEARVRGQAQYEEKRFAEAAASFAAVVASGGATAADWVNLALARFEAGDDPGTVEALQAAESLDPDDVSHYYLRGLVLRRAGDEQGARAAFERVIASDPTDPAALYNLGAVLEALGATEAARQQYEIVIAMGFDIGLQHHVSSLYRAGFLLARAGNQEAARPYLERYQQESRRLSQAQRAPAALEVGRFKRIRVAARNLVAANPDSAMALAFEERIVAGAGRAAGWLVQQSMEAAPTLIGTGASLQVLHGSEVVAVAAVEGPAALGDYDRDGIADLYIAGPAGGMLLHGTPDPARPFERVEAELPAHGDAREVVWVDADHDGDLDVLVVEPTAPGLRLLQNRGAGTFVDVTGDSGLAGAGALGVAWADFDADGDVDLYVLREGGGALYTNVRFGRFEDIATAAGARGPTRPRAVIAEDLDNDGAVDLAIASAAGVSLLRNTGAGTFLPAPGGPPQLPPSLRVRSGDFNLDGFLDLVVDTAEGARLLASAGDWEWRPAALPTTATDSIQTIADHDADGALDLLVQRSGALLWLRQTGPVANWLRLQLNGIKNNVQGIGALIELKAGGLYQARLVRDPVMVLGLGAGTAAEVLRITWPNGIVQNETDVAAARALGPIAEVERLEGSCPLLYTWNGERWELVNEVLGVGPLGMPLAAGVIHPADFDEYVPVAGEALRRRGDGWEIRLTEELRETGYVDAVRLLAVDSRSDLTVIADERFSAPPHPEFRLFALSERLPVTAIDQDGLDWTAALASVDGSWTRPFEPRLYEGLATEHFLEMELPHARAGEPVRLFLTGWVYWATGSINLQVDDDPRVMFAPVSLQVPDGRGGWRTAIDDIGLPNAKNTTMSIDLTPWLRADDPRVRIGTTMRLYWDAAWYATGQRQVEGLRPVGDWQQEWRVPRPGTLALVAPGGAAAADQVRLTVLAPVAADLHFRGFSELQRGVDGFEWFNYQSVGFAAPWNQHRGSYTRYGDVSALVDRADDRYVIVGTGDELSVRLAGDLPPLPEGWRRDWLVYLNGWVKDGDPNTVYGDRVEPLPFHAMSSYPYPADEVYPESAEHASYQLGYNTRPQRLINGPLQPR